MKDSVKATNNATVENVEGTTEKVVATFQQTLDNAVNATLSSEITDSTPFLNRVDNRIKAIARLSNGLGLMLVPECMNLLGNELYKEFGYTSVGKCLTERYGISKQLASQLKKVGETFCDVSICEGYKIYTLAPSIDYDTLGFAKIRAIAYNAKDKDSARKLAKAKSTLKLSAKDLEEQLSASKKPKKGKEGSDDSDTSETSETSEGSGETTTSTTTNSVTEVTKTTSHYIECVGVDDFIAQLKDWLSANPNDLFTVTFTATKK